MKKIKEREIIVATNSNIKRIVAQEIEKYGLDADLNHIDTSQVTDFSNLFSSSHFVGDISKWNTSNAKDMFFMFASSKFNGDISNWDVSNVEDMACMFTNSQFNQDLSHWHLEKFEEFKSYKQSRRNDLLYFDLQLDISCFQHLSSFSSLLHCLENFDVDKRHLVKHLFYCPNNLLSSSSKCHHFLNFVDFVNKQQFEQKGIIFPHYLDYLHSGHPLFSCNVFHVEDNNFSLYQDWIYNVFSKKLDRHDYITFNNFDELFFILSPKYHCSDLLGLTKIDIFFKDYQNILSKLDELLKVLNKTVSELPNVKFVIDEFFEMEKQFIQEKKQDYFNFFQNDLNQSFSDFYPYYSQEQKKVLLRLSLHNNTSLYSDELHV